MFKRKKVIYSAEDLIRFNMLAGMYVRYLQQATECQYMEPEKKKEQALLWLQANTDLSWEMAGTIIEAAVYDMKHA